MCTHSFHSPTRPVFLSTWLIRIWHDLFPLFPAVEMVQYFSTVQIWKQGIVRECPLQFTHGGHYKIVPSMGPNQALFGSSALSARLQQDSLHACWAVKIQMGGGRWVISTMLFPLKGTRLPQDGQLSSMNCREATHMWHMWADGRGSFPTDGTLLPHGVGVSSQWQVSKCRKTRWESDSRLDLPESPCGEQWNLLSRCLPSVTHSSKTQRSHYFLRWCKPCQSFRSIIWAMWGISSWPCLLLGLQV